MKLIVSHIIKFQFTRNGLHKLSDKKIHVEMRRERIKK